MKNVESVQKYMAKNLITFYPDTDIRNAVEIIVKNKISGAPVLDYSGKLVGIISEKDCIRLIVEGPYYKIPGGNGTVADYMSTQVRTLPDDTSVVDVAYQFANSSYRRFPIVDKKGKLVGQISRRDILRAIIKMNPEIQHSPSSWKDREPMVHPSKAFRYSQNA